MKKSKNIYYIICSPDLNGCPPLSYLIVSDLTERTFLSGEGGWGVPAPPPTCVRAWPYSPFEMKNKELKFDILTRNSNGFYIWCLNDRHRSRNSEH